MNEEKNQETDVEALLREADVRAPEGQSLAILAPPLLSDRGLINRLASALRAERSRKTDTTRAETPDAKRDDVEALLAEAEREGESLAPNRDRRHLLLRLAAALRAERTRADGWRRVGEDNDRHAFEACGHLVAVLQHAWPEGTTAPACVRAAREFLAGKEVPSSDEAQRLRADLTTAERFQKIAEGRAREAESVLEKIATIARQALGADATIGIASTGTRARANVEALVAMAGKLRANLSAEEEAHANTKGELATEHGIVELFCQVLGADGDASSPGTIARAAGAAGKLRALAENPFDDITPKDDTERKILDSIRTAVKGNSGNGAAMIFDLLVHATRVAGERADQLAQLATADERSFADLAVMAERSWKEQAPFASIKIAFEWGFVRGAQAILGEPAYTVKGGA